ncbi:MAG: siphovirus Gp157 family protein, partial [Lachnospira sp.]|nr:siphovirus Gp157 family protein [Lachnospira sp.]
MTLYEINSALQAAVDDCIDPETGEILDESLLDAIDGLQMARDEKIENICLCIKNLRSDADQLKAEKQAFEKRYAATKAKADRLTKYLS